MTRCPMCGTELADATRRFCGGDTCDRVLEPRALPAATGWMGRGLAIAVTLLVSLVFAGAAHGQVPTAKDIAACNEDAPRAVKAGGASPTSGDQARADSARGAVPAKSAAETVTTGVVESTDPQIHGMQRAGANDAAYQAAYRSCMRRKGF
jgi:hypothetical protein